MNTNAVILPNQKLPIAFFTAGKQSTHIQLLESSDELAQMLGYTPSAFAKRRERNDFFFICEEDLTNFQKFSAMVFQHPGGEPHLLLRLRKANANTLPVLCWAKTLPEAAKSPAACFFFKEQSAILKQESLSRLYRKLQSEVAEYDMLLESTGVCIIKISLEKNYSVEWCNEATYRAIGYTREQYAANFRGTIRDYFKAKGRESTFLEQTKNIEDARRRHCPRIPLHFRLPTRLGSIWIQGTGTFTETTPDTHMAACLYLVFTDITKSVQAQENLLRAKQEADQANTAKSTFLASISHDLRTPLNGILGFTGLALQENEPAKKQAYLQKIQDSANLLTDLVNDTLDLSRIESGKMTLELTTENLSELMNAILSAVRPSAEKKQLHLLTEFSLSQNEIVQIDALKTKKVLLNLLSNAIKYTPANGTVFLKVSRLQPAADTLTHRIIIQDNGIGMSAGFLQHLYEPFTQENRPEAGHVQGTGLGLSIVRRIVALMDGRIQVNSELHHGTTFTVDLPMPAADGHGQQAAETELTAPASLTGKTILLCEDNEINAEIITILLQQKGLHIDWAKNGQEGCDYFAASLPGHYAAIFMDIRMPVLDGYAATAKIRASTHPDAKSVPIIAMTADAFEEDIRKGKSIGMNEYLTKPIQINKINALLAKFP